MRSKTTRIIKTVRRSRDGRNVRRNHAWSESGKGRNDEPLALDGGSRFFRRIGFPGPIRFDLGFPLALWSLASLGNLRREPDRLFFIRFDDGLVSIGLAFAALEDDFIDGVIGRIYDFFRFFARKFHPIGKPAMGGLQPAFRRPNRFGPDLYFDRLAPCRKINRRNAAIACTNLPTFGVFNQTSSTKTNIIGP